MQHGTHLPKKAHALISLHAYTIGGAREHMRIYMTFYIEPRLSSVTGKYTEKSEEYTAPSLSIPGSV